MDQAQFNQLTLPQLAAQTGIDPTTWSKWFNRDRPFNEDSLAEAAGRLDLTPSKLLTLCHQRSIEHLEARLQKTCRKLQAVRQSKP